jgi:hypothetical protein
MAPQENQHMSTASAAKTDPQSSSANVTSLIKPKCSDFSSTAGGKPSVTNPGSVHVVVTKDVALEHQEKWLDMANELAKETWKEPGCISYDFVRSKMEDSDKAERRFVIIEEVRVG